MTNVGVQGQSGERASGQVSCLSATVARGKSSRQNELVKVDLERLARKQRKHLVLCFLVTQLVPSREGPWLMDTFLRAGLWELPITDFNVIGHGAFVGEISFQVARVTC